MTDLRDTDLVRRGLVLGGTFAGLAPAAFAAASAAAPTVAFPDYRPEAKLSDTLRSWGSPDMGPLLAAWQKAFRRYHPEVRYADKLKGTETAQAALYTDVADFALMDREILTLERHVMLRRKHGVPLEFQVAVGSERRADRSPALAILVHPDNPLAKLTLAQLDGIFGEARTGAWDDKFAWKPERARGAERNLRTWGQLGLGGDWADKPIQTYGYPITNYSPLPGPMLSFRNRVFDGGDMWNANLREYQTGTEIVNALAADRFGIAYAPLPDSGAAVKALAVGKADGEAVALTRQNVASRRYPLARGVFIYIAPDDPLLPRVREFMRFVLSREGQQIVAREGGYLPLTPSESRAQWAKLA